MKLFLLKVSAFCAGAIFLAACSPEPKAVNQATLETVEVQGISFHDPLPSDKEEPADPEAEADAEVEIVPELVSIDEAASDEELLLNLAAIPAEQSPAASPAPEPVSPEPPAAVEEEQSAPAPVAQAPPAAAPGEYLPVSFDTLAGFPYEEPIPNEGEKPEDVEERRKKDQIPALVQALNGQRTVVEGWMVPMEVADDGSVRSFVLVKTQPQCCFGDMQAMNEWVDVTMTGGKNAEFNVDMPMKVFGELEVGEQMEDGFVLSIYRMKADRVEL